MGLPSRLTNSALRLIAYSNQWLARNLNIDRVLALIGLLATIISTGLSFVLALATSYAIPLTVLSVFLGLLILLAMSAILRSARTNLAVIPPYPYHVRSKYITVDIFDATGCNANIELHEDIISLQDGLATMRKSFWGDWDALDHADLICNQPRGAVIADHFHEGFASIFLISLRHIYNYKNEFSLKTRLAVRNGFRQSQSEYYCYTASAPVDYLQICILLPAKKRFQPNSLLARSGYVGFFHYTEQPIPPTHITFTEDGRQQITYDWSRVHDGRTCTIYWDWDPSPAENRLE